MAWKDPATAASMSASARMMFGDFPPSSSVTRLSAPPAFAPISRPTSVEPVKAILSTPACSTSAAPVLPSPRSEEHTSELQSPYDLECRLLLETKNGNPAARLLHEQQTREQGRMIGGITR